MRPEDDAESPRAAADEPDFLLSMETAYLQRQGEWQISARSSRITGRSTEREFEWDDGKRDIERKRSRETEFEHTLGVEYGITDRLQVEMNAPYETTREHSHLQRVEEHDGWGDLEMGLNYALTRDRGAWPAIAWEVELTAPTGDVRNGIGTERTGCGTSLRLSKNFGKWIGYLDAGYDWTPNAQLQYENRSLGPRRDLQGTHYGIAAGIPLDEHWTALLELAGESGETLELDSRHWESELMFVPGIRYGIETSRAGDWEFGIGVPVGLTHESPDWGVVVQLQWEFGGDDD